jgi:hypothetical protein
MRIFALAALVGFTVCASADESPWVRNYQMTNLPRSLPANASSNFTTSLAIRPNRPTGIYIAAVGTTNITNSLIWTFRGSVDNTTNTFPLFTLTSTVTGTTKFHTWTNVLLQNLPFLHLSACANGATGVTNLTVNLEVEK